MPPTQVLLKGRMSSFEPQLGQDIVVYALSKTPPVALSLFTSDDQPTLPCLPPTFDAIIGELEALGAETRLMMAAMISVISRTSLIIATPYPKSAVKLLETVTRGTVVYPIAHLFKNVPVLTNHPTIIAHFEQMRPALLEKVGRAVTTGRLGGYSIGCVIAVTTGPIDAVPEWFAMKVSVDHDPSPEADCERAQQRLRVTLAPAPLQATPLVDRYDPRGATRAREWAAAVAAWRGSQTVDEADELIALYFADGAGGEGGGSGGFLPREAAPLPTDDDAALLEVWAQGLRARLAEEA